MKFYNPFKPHIVENQLGEYFIRLYTMFRWEYYHKPFDSFVTGLMFDELYRFSSKEQAQKHMESYVYRKRCEKLKDKRSKKMKVVK